MNKKYYWLKLKDDFFNQKEIKKLRKIAGGDTYTIIYLKMLLLAIKKDNKLYFDGVEESFVEELALELNEDVNNIQMTVAFLQKHKLLEVISEEEFFLPQGETMTGSETSTAERMRKSRKKAKEDEEEHSEIDKSDSKCNNVTPVLQTVTPVLQNCYTEKEIEKEIDIKKQTCNEVYDYWLSLDIVRHRKLTVDMEKAINKALKEYSKEEVYQGMDNYKTVLKDETYFYSNIFTLDEFLKQKNGLPHFLEEGIRWINYCATKSNNKPTEPCHDIQQGGKFADMSVEETFKFLSELEK